MNGPDTIGSGSPISAQRSTCLPAVPGDLSQRRRDLAAAVLIFLYCLLFAVMRVSVSPSMELDESEQFLNGSSFSLGHAHQPPLYSWIVRGVSLVCGMNLSTLIAVKYAVLFSFVISFYLIARMLWNPRGALLVTASLLFFPTYSYEFNRDLSHSILVTAMASASCYLFLRLLRRRGTADYIFLGVSLGLGLLAKYNFFFFLAAMLLAAASFQEGRSVLRDRRILLALACCLVVFSPHAFWLVQNKFLSFRHALVKAETGELSLAEPQKVLSIVLSSYSGVLIFLAVFTALFGLRIRREDGTRGPARSFFGYLVLYGLSLPLVSIIVLRAGHFSERWLAPILFCVPLALFSRVDPEAASPGAKALGSLSVLVAVGIFMARAFIGFFPDQAGKVERIHIPFGEISAQLKEELNEKGIGDPRKLVLVADSELLAANIGYYLPGATLVITDGGSDSRDGGKAAKTTILLWDAGQRGEGIPDAYIGKFPSARPLGVFRAPYLRSSKSPPYALGAAVLR